MIPRPEVVTGPRNHTAAGTDGDWSIRVAAVGDLHATVKAAGRFRPALLHAAAQADVLLLAGDLTNNGRPDEARCVADELRDLGPVTAATLGNHDHHNGCPDEVAAILTDAGIQVLEGTGMVLRVRGTRLGIAGVKGFGGGFPFADSLLHEFGEPQMKAFVRHGRESAEALAGHECGGSRRRRPRPPLHRRRPATAATDPNRGRARSCAPLRPGRMEHRRQPRQHQVGRT